MILTCSIAASALTISPSRRGDEHERIAAGEDHLPDLAVGADIVERGIELLARERAPAPDHFAAEAKAAIDRADMDGLEQHAVGIAVHDARDRTVRLVADRIGHLLGPRLELSRIGNELARDRVARIGRIDERRRRRRSAPARSARPPLRSSARRSGAQVRRRSGHRGGATSCVLALMAEVLSAVRLRPRHRWDKASRADGAQPVQMSIRVRRRRGARRNPGPGRAPGRCRLADRQNSVLVCAAQSRSEDKMKNYLDGGEAILEAFRKLKIDYIMSSPGSEWSPIWEALARQKLDNKAGPTFVESWHETLAVNMATGYTLITGRPQAVLLHAGVGMLQGSMGVHGAMQNEVPMVVMSGESQTLGEDPDLDIEQQWYGGLTVGGIERFVEPVAKWARAVTSPYTLYESVDPRRRNGAARAERPDLSERRARAHAARLDAAGRGTRSAAGADRAAAAGGRREGRRAAAQGQEPGDRDGDRRTRPPGIFRPGGARRPARHPGDQRAGQRLREFPDRPSALSRLGQLQGAGRCRSRPARRRARALVSGAAAADQRQDRRHP